MAYPTPDQRSQRRKQLDEQIAAEPPRPPPTLPPDAAATSVEAHLGRRRPVAVTGIVENGLVRPLDSTIKLPEGSRVIIVAAG